MIDSRPTPVSPPITVLGGGLAGSEAAWQLARRGHRVRLVEMRPATTTPAHHTDRLAELVCSNSLKSESLEAAHGALKAELTLAGSLLLELALRHRVPAGQALAVDRAAFAEEVTAAIAACPAIERVSQEATALPGPERGPTLIATGPLTAPALAADLARLCGAPHLSFYDALAPIVDAETVDLEQAFWATRYDKGEADYLNCPLDAEQYTAFLAELLRAECVLPESFEEVRFFDACQPVEQIALGGPDALRFGPLKPVGLKDPRTGIKPHAVVQLRHENRAGTAFNLVGFQTRLTQAEQRRVFRMIPALRRAVFLRYGAIHRNSFVDAPAQLAPDLSLRRAPHLFVAGQLAGGEGYVEAIATGLLAALAIDCRVRAQPFTPPPTTTTLGGLLRYLQLGPVRGPFSPSNVHWGLVDEYPGSLYGRASRSDRRVRLGERAVRDFAAWLAWRERPAARSLPLPIEAVDLGQPPPGATIDQPPGPCGQ